MEEPECYDSIRVRAEWGQSTQENEKKLTFAVRTVSLCVCVCVCVCVEEPKCYDSIRVHAEWGQSTRE